MSRVSTFAWPATLRRELETALARHSGFGSSTIETEKVALFGANLEAMLRASAPALVELPGGHLLGLAHVRGEGARILTPEQAVQTITLDGLRALLCQDAEAPHLDEVDRIVSECVIPRRRSARVRAALLRDRLRAKRIAWAWQVRVSPGSSFGRQLSDAGLMRRARVFLLGHVAEAIAWVVAWWMVGRGALEGHLDQGWLAGWALLLVTMTMLRVISTRSQGVFTIGAGGLLKQRLLAGAVKLDPDEIRQQGAGQLLGRVLESEQLESLASSGGLLALMALVELALALVVITCGAGGARQAALLAVWTAVACGIAWRYGRRRSDWAAQRLSMTHTLVEKMTGHRTRIAQQPSDAWHEGDDELLNRYVDVSQAMDRYAVHLAAFIPRGWLVLGFTAMAPAFLSVTVEPAELAIALGGILLAYRAFKRLVEGAVHLAGAGIAWRQASTLFHGAAAPDNDGARVRACSTSDVLLEARDLSFGFRRGGTVLSKCSVHIRRGDRVLLEGNSGAGKSTLLSLLAGLRRPDSGLLLAGGLDRQTLGDARWRKAIACVPQYHENHILTASLAFNLLIGRHGPATRTDFEEAEAVCRELGLGGLLDRMPAGLQQIVGEGGWQLSQGEKSRVFLARALLQGADLLVLDESFAALDPDTLRRSLECVLKRAPSLLVAAHV